MILSNPIIGANTLERLYRVLNADRYLYIKLSKILDICTLQSYELIDNGRIILPITFLTRASLKQNCLVLPQVLLNLALMQS
jgi:hypothetical protein